jgi:hypothetical protein
MKLALRLAVLVIVLALGVLTWWQTRETTAQRAAPAPEVAAAPAEPAANEPAVPAPDAAARAAADAPSELDAETASNPASTFEPPTVRAPTALLKVHVVSKEKGLPLAGKQVSAMPKDAREWSASSIDGSHAALNEAPHTNDRGDAELEVNAGRDLLVWTEHEDWKAMEVAALAPLEVREITFALPTEPDLVLFGRVVDATTGKGLAGADVRLDTSTNSREAPTENVDVDERGAFELHVRSWEQHFASAAANGYARIFFALEPGHETRERALEVRLARAAALDVVVRDHGRSVARATVAITTDSYRFQQESGGFSFYFPDADPSWTVVADGAGRAEIRELPPSVPLHLAVRVAGREEHVEAIPITLAAGERREIEVLLDAGASILGRVEDSSGAPVAKCEVWRAPLTAGHQLALLSFEDPAARNTTDEQGRFHFDDVSLGDWLIGPKPIARWDKDAKTADAFVGFAQLVHVETGTRQLQVTLRVDRGLFFSGLVLGPVGEAVAECHVQAIINDLSWQDSDTTDAAGHFAIGPVPAAAFSLRADGDGSRYASSAPISARPGDQGIVLRVQLGCAVRARATGPDGQPRKCDFTLSRTDDALRFARMQPGRDLATFGGLEAGAYCLSACSPDGLFGQYPRIALHPGEDVGLVDIQLEPGAKLRLRYEGSDDFANFAIFNGGAFICGDGAERGHSSVHVVPADTVEVRWRQRSDRTEASRSVTLTAGEERELVWDGTP